MKKISNRETANLIKKDGVFILYNDSHTIIEKDVSLTEAYKKYRILEDKIEKKFFNLDLDYNIVNTEIRGNTSKIKIEKSNKTLIFFFVFFVGVVLYLSYSFDPRGLVKDASLEMQHVVNNTIRSMPSTFKNTLLYTKNGQLRCFSCVMEEIIDGLSSGVSDGDTARITEKINSLKLQYGFGEPELESKDVRLGIKIKDNEPAIILSSNIHELDENSDTNITLMVIASEPATSDITVTLATSGNAIDGIDYSPIHGTTITIPAGATTGYKNFMLIDDSDHEGLENIYIEISNVSYSAYENKE